MQFICIYCATYAHVCSQHILLETLSGQLSIYIWFQARNWVGLSRSFSPQHWSCSTCISWFPSKLAAGHGLKYSRLHDNHWTGSFGVGYCKIFIEENFSLLECFKLECHLIADIAYFLFSLKFSILPCINFKPPILTTIFLCAVCASHHLLPS